MKHINASRRALAPTRKGVSVHTFRRCIVHCKRENTNHSIFQLDKNSRFVSLNDVKDAFEVTRNFSTYQRLKYFSDMGIHYTRALHYVRLVEQLEEAFTSSTKMTVDQSYIEEDEQDSYAMPRTPLSSEDIGRFIDEVMQERDEHENTHLVGEAKPYLKHYDNAINMAKTVEQLAMHSKNISLLIIVMMFIHYLCIEWNVYVGNRT